MTPAFFGLTATVILALLGAGALTLVHFAVRPKRPPYVRTSEALRQLEPRGGRHRFGVRLFEVGALCATWLVGLAVLTVLAVASSATAASVTFVAVFIGAFAVAAWWAWRRGVLRAQNRDQEPNLLLLGRRRRG